MAIELRDNYLLRVVFGEDVEVVQSPDALLGCTITSDLDYLVPILDLSLKNDHGIIHQTIPPDRRLNDIRIEMARDLSASEYNTYDFELYRSFPDDNRYRVTGYLKVDNLFSPLKSRGFNDSVKAVLEGLANDEFMVDRTEVSPTLESIRRTLVQPAWPNIDLLRYLRRNIAGFAPWEYYYSCFIKMDSGKSVFVFKSLRDFITEETKYRFIYGDVPMKNVEPIFDYKIYNNMQALGVFGGKSQNYGYFDYDNDKYVNDASINIDTYPSLSQYFLLEDKDIKGEVDDVSFFVLGRNNSFTSDFGGRVGREYYEGTTNLIHLWIYSNGLPSVQPGDIVEVFFPQTADGGNVTGMPYNGCWMVKRVVHSFGVTFLTRLLLVRSGVDTDAGNTLYAAVNFVKRNAQDVPSKGIPIQSFGEPDEGR